MKNYRFLILSLLFLVWLSSQATAEIYQSVRYVRMDYARDTAYMYDENFQRFPDYPRDRRTSYESFEGRSVWMLGTEVHVVRRLADAVEVMDNNPAYAKLNHHVVFAYTGKPATDVGGQRPIAAGSELNDGMLPEPYGYKMEGGNLYIWNWHWHNLGGVPRDEEVYLQFIITFDSECRGCRDTNVTWIDSVPGRSEFCVDPGNNVYNGFQYPMIGRIRPVAVVPHIHDHGYLMEMVYNGNVVMSFEPQLTNQYSYHISHTNCNFTGWHQHDGHVVLKSISSWAMESGRDLVFEPGTSVWTRTYYDNPHTDRTDGMGILVTFWEAVP